MNHRRVFVLAVLSSLAVTATAAAAKPKEAPGKGGQFKVKQCAAFVALARKGAALKGVHVQGRFQMLGASPNMPPDA